MIPPPAKILLVDDLEENLVALEALLRKDGVELLRAKSGIHALELLLVHDVALALLDVQMPEMDGLELAELMRGSERTRRIPIIFLTAGAHDTQRVFRGYEIGAVDFLYKPIDPVLLSHKVTTFVDLHRQGLEVRELLRLNEMFVAAVSHDLRSPLSTVVMGVALLDAQLQDPNAKRTLTRMRSGADRMRAMLDQLYDLARARMSGGIPLEPRATNLRSIADKVAEELRLAHPGRLLLLDYDDGPTQGVWDEVRLGQVLANLVGNALRHGDPEEAVVVRLRGGSPTVVIEVQNGGVVPVDLQPHLFEPFRSGAHLSREGLGLGLYIVRQIVLAHGGEIEFRSSRETGTIFRVRLPTSLPRSAPLVVPPP